jgi:glycosyltransferase involved in cell wall biosynthesis
MRGLAHARVLMKQVERFHPKWARCALLVDAPAGSWDPASESFRIVDVRSLPLADKQGTLFYYPPSDLDAAVKPWFLAYLFDTCGFDRAVFIDARSWLAAPLDALVAELDSGAPLTAAPHLLRGAGDEKRPSEMDVLRWGVHDAALVGMAIDAPNARELLQWWSQRTHRHAVRRPEEGLYRDQRWLDLAAGLWKISTLRDPSYNVAYFNLNERQMTHSGSGFLVHGRPLTLFRFPGFDPERPRRLTAADERFGDNLPEAAEMLARDYADELFGAGYMGFRDASYGFSRFQNGASISDNVRLLYQRDRQVRQECGDDPFATGPGPFNRPYASDPLVTRLMGEIWRGRLDLQRIFPRIDGLDAKAFATWFVNSAPHEYDLSHEFVEPVARRLAGTARENPTNGSGHSNVPLAEGVEVSSSEAEPRSMEGSSVRDSILARVRGARRRLARRGLVRATSGLLASGLGIATAGISVRTALIGSAPRSPRLAAPTAPRHPSVNGSPAGLNICGYITADLGIGQSARGAGLAARAAGIDFSMIDFAIGTTSPKTDRSFAAALRERNEYSVNLVHVNADQFPVFRHAMGPWFFEGKKTIAYWHWELPEFPDRWLSSFAGVDEIWVPSRFVQTAVSAKSPVPVVLMPHAIALPDVRPSRRRFALPERSFLFLLMYDLLSYQERKNPQAAIHAFRKAFDNSGHAALVIKVLNAEKCPDDMEALRASLRDLPHTVLLTGTMSRQDVYDLEATCDAFVSLHRSEGFGLGPAECMRLGKPVVATNWSGNSDFMSAQNSCPVGYELVALERDHGPYEAGQFWADPDVDHAASLMRALVDDPTYAARVGARAQQTMMTEYSPESIGRRYRARLAIIQEAGLRS